MLHIQSLEFTTHKEIQSLMEDKFVFEAEHFQELPNNRAAKSTTIAREYYDAWNVLQDDLELTAEQLHAYCAYASIYRSEVIEYVNQIYDSEFYTLLSILFTNEQFKLLEYTRETAFSSWVRETYEHWSGQFQAKEVLTANEVDRYCIYASLLRLEILNELKRTLINVQTNLVLILELEAKFTPECMQRLEEWYTDLSEAQMLSFMQFYTTSIPVPDVYHERATFEWLDLASAHCCLGDTMFDESQDAEPSCSIKPLAQTDPSHATSIAISILIFCVLLCSNWTWSPRDQCRYDSFPCRANQLSTKDGGLLNLIQHLKTLLLWKLIRRRSTLGADFTRLDCVVVDSVAFNFEQPIVKRIRIRYVVVVVDLFFISCMQCCITHRWCPPPGSPSADRHDIHLFDS